MSWWFAFKHEVHDLWKLLSLQADVDEEKVKQFHKLKELPPTQLRQVCLLQNIIKVGLENWVQKLLNSIKEAKKNYYSPPDTIPQCLYEALTHLHSLAFEYALLLSKAPWWFLFLYSQFRPRPYPQEWYKLDASHVYKNRNTLREYQLEGVNWLTFCWCNRWTF